MKKTVIILLLFFTTVLYANDFRWNLVNALTRSDYPAAENLINQNINTMPAAEKGILTSFALNYSHGNITLNTLELLQRYNVRPTGFDLFTAINRNQPNAVVDFIMANGVTANGEILLLAMEKQRFDLAERFIQSGADVNYQYPLTRNDSDGMTALLYASRFNNFELVKMLAERGANINARNREGGTALSISQANGNAQISEFLTDKGAVQTLAHVNPQFPRTGGIANFLDAQVLQFQPGTYRLTGAASGGTRDLLFTGDANSGRAGFISGSRVINGVYHVAGANLTVMLNGNSFVYNIDSNNSFSGNGEVWIKR